ncbi:MAG: NAD(P)/FAD-dependent oxidoreductase [Dehalococcoidales bacterium]|nr:NAD(P)/FAD-dependent oxidoreductase [Dehalococcoidales bacterium]
MTAGSMIIIGAGIAGLSTGCYGQMNGYHTHIFEMDNRPGGLCTAWKRKGYTITTIHWFMGTGPNSSYYKIWEELGAIQGSEIVYYDEDYRYEGSDGKVFNFYTDIDRLEGHMKELAPEDIKVIEEFIKGLRSFVNFDMPIEKAPEVCGPFDNVKMMLGMVPYMPAMMKWKKISLGDFARRFKNPLLRDFFLSWGPPAPHNLDRGFFPMMYMLMSLSSQHAKTIGYSIGGSFEFAKAIEKRYLDLGGELTYKSRVTRIIVKDNRAVGIELEDGTKHYADYVISAADGHSTIFDMLDGKYISDEIQGYYDSMPRFPSIVHVGLGVDRTFDELPHSSFGLNFPLEKPVTVAGTELKRLWVSAIHNFDNTLAPDGKTTIRLWFPSDYDYWKNISSDPELYKAEKEKVVDTIVHQLDKRFPGIAEKIEMSDVATPLTYERYTGNWRGCFEGWLPTVETFNLSMSKELPGLGNFYMTGQWVEPGGSIPIVAVSGRNVIQIICKRDKRRFTTMIP